MSRRYFITSTGTGIGKTYVTCALIRQARALGLSVAAYKPLISGFDTSEIATSDTGAILAALGETATDEAVARVSPWRFKAPLAPNMAARAEGRGVEVEDLFAFSNNVLGQEYDVTLIEGVGGVMVPLDSRRTVLDWIAASGAAAILVAGDYLGTISHTLTAVEVLRARGIPLAAVVVSEGVTGEVPFAETLADLATRVPARVLGLWRGDDGAALSGLLG